jgi:Flagellar hook-length control protein FliK
MRVQMIPNPEPVLLARPGKHAAEAESFAEITNQCRDEDIDKQTSDDLDRAAFDTSEISFHADALQEENLTSEKLEEGYLLFGSLFSEMEQRLKPIDEPIEMQKGQGRSSVEPRERRVALPHGGTEAKLKTAILLDFAQAKARITDEKAIEPVKPKPGKREPQLQNEDMAIATSDTEVVKHRHRAGKVDQMDVGEHINIAKSAETTLVEDTQSSRVQSKMPELQQPAFSGSDHRQAVVASLAAELRTMVRAPRVDGASLQFERAAPQTLRLNLHPMELGAVDISVSRRGKSLQITLTPATRETRQILVDDAKSLLDRLGLSHAEANHVHLRIDMPDAAPKTLQDVTYSQAAFRPDHGSANTQGEGTPRRQTQPGPQGWHEASEGSHEFVEDAVSRGLRADALYL